LVAARRVEPIAASAYTPHPPDQDFASRSPAPMIKRFRSYLAPRAAAKAAAAVPPGQRVYAIGDIHGRLDLFERLIAAIDADDAARGPAETTVILLGDLIDRGPASAGVIDAARAWRRRRRVRMLAGNHEEMLLESFFRRETLRHFLRYGGKETILSYPIEPEVYQQLSLESLQALLPDIVPPEHIELLESMEDYVAVGDYLFVHAGIRPGVALEQQKRSDLRWIRDAFTEHPGDHGVVVVHGHTISEEVEERPNRIGIDTGAFMTGRLTAVGLEAAERWFLTARDPAAAAEHQLSGRNAA
jgi:serine/threonine protein phosphatase 1